MNSLPQLSGSRREMTESHRVGAGMIPSLLKSFLRRSDQGWGWRKNMYMLTGAPEALTISKTLSVWELRQLCSRYGQEEKLGPNRAFFRGGEAQQPTGLKGVTERSLLAQRRQVLAGEVEGCWCSK